MRTLFAIVLLLLFVSIHIQAGELITNGDFEQPLTEGWDEIRVGSNITINRGTGYDPDPDYEANVYKGTGSGFAKLYQIVDIPAIHLDFTVNAELYAYDNSSSAWAGAAVMLSYMDEDENVLGITYICYRSPGCPWTNTSTTHVIPASNSSWNNYSFNIEDELTNLSGVDPLQVKKIEVSLLSQGSWC